MAELKAMYARQRKYIFFLLALYVLGWGFTPYSDIFLGLILGTSLSLFNLWLLADRTYKLGEAVARGDKSRKKSLGLALRMGAALLGIAISMQYPEKFHLISFVLGLMTSYIVIMIDFYMQSFHLRK